MQYYIDSSENASDDPKDALDGPYDVLENAQSAAREMASKKPGTIFYVNEVRAVVTQVYIAEAVMQMKTEVVNGDSNKG